MDSVIEKFYSNGKTTSNKFTQFGAFSNGLVTQNTINNPNSGFKTMGVLNGGVHSVPENIDRKAASMTEQDFLRPKNLVFNSTSDMLFPNMMPQAKGELKINYENEKILDKKNATKMQMMEEKMKNLELKSQRLEVINDFFFDMFENNLVKEELQKQREAKAKEMEENKSDEEEEVYPRPVFFDAVKKKKGKKMKKGKDSLIKSKDFINQYIKNQRELNLNKYDDNKPEFDPKEFQLKTVEKARNILKNIKENVGNYLIEEQLKKNEQLQSMSEDILEMRSALMNKLERIQLKQRLQMEKIAFCLQNSGNKKIEGLAGRLLSGDYYNYMDVPEYDGTTEMESIKNGGNGTIGSNNRRSASALNKRQSISSKRQSISTKRQSISNKRQSINQGTRTSLARRSSQNLIKGERKSLNEIKEEDDDE